MHQLYFVAVPNEGTEDADTAMSNATQLLDENNFCNSENGYFSNSKGDWYEVGGRWASVFCERHQWYKDAIAEIEEYLQRKENLDDDGKPFSIRGCSYGDDAKTKKQAELRERCELIFGKHRPEEYPKVPFDRYYSEEKYSDHKHKRDDCAEILTDELLEYLREYAQREHYTDLEIFATDDSGFCEEWTLKNWINEVDKNPSEHIGKYWIVAIDYHI